jgi:HEAT repeat protein
MNHDAITAELKNPDLEVRLSAIRSVADHPDRSLPDEVLDALMQCLGADRKVIQRRGAEALAATAASDSRIVERLRSTFSSGDPRARWGAVYALGLVSSEGALDMRAMPTLVEVLSGDDGDIRWAAAELLVRLGRTHGEAVSAQLIRLARGGNLNARKMALYCLRDVGGAREDLVELAESCCEDRQNLLKMAALALLSRIANSSESSERAVTLAIRLLESDGDAGVRRCAAVALGHIGNHSTSAIEALERAAIEEGDIYMKRSAQRALTRLRKAK